MSKIIELTTSLFPIINVGMYESWIDPNHFFEDERWQLEEQNLEETDFDMDKYTDSVRECANIVLKGLNLKEYGIISITMPKIVSPKYYNYSTDIGNLDVEVDDDFDDFLRSTIDELRKTDGWERRSNNKIKRLYGSYDGFWSFMPQSVAEVYKLEEDDYERCVSIFFELLMKLPVNDKNEDAVDGDLIALEFNELCHDCLSYSEFATTESILPQELFEMSVDKLSEIMWDLFDVGVKYPYKSKDNKDGRALFLKWCKDNGYETEADLKALLSQQSA